ncbi:MAG: B12-binding domain-containing radical SAM protein [Anaerolineales bacterium]|nr:B12-binding domain-containing radical SAM protein [Anaerolineales bacterium]
MRPRVVLYNPQAVFWTMPLALLAVGSALDPARYEVVIVDGRLEADPAAALVAQLAPHTVCVGVTVLTGAPIRDVLAASRAVKVVQPGLPVVWGGWHPSLFPEQCLAEPSVDAVVIGQGEDTFAAVVERLAAGQSLAGVAGAAWRSAAGRPVVELPRAMRDVNALPPHNYHLIDVPRYFAAKGKRQLDYISSQGCRFRCAFCADPTVYQRGWYGLTPARLAAELAAYHARWGLDEIAFQDETFFTSRARVEAVADAFLAAGLRVPWTATMRADQGARLDDALLEKCKRAGLRRAMIGVESGSAAMLARIQKDITPAQVYASAERLARHGLGAIFNFIVGFPGESDAGVQASLDAAARLRALSPDFEVALFFFRPYPGNPIAGELLAQGYRFPDTLAAWADFDYIGGREAWVTHRQWQRVERFKFYQRYAYGRNHLLRWPLSRLSRWRVQRHYYDYPWEKALMERLRPAAKLS